MEPRIYHFKILVPSAAAGAIIGKGGVTIAQLQKDAEARVKMSKATEFYPGTTERVCLVSGHVEGIMKIHDFIMEKISEQPPNASPASTSPISSAASSLESSTESTSEIYITRREKQVKILVPNSTAGMIIGKGGSYIKQIKEESGAYVQISQKSVDVALPERCVTVIGELENNRKACSMILSKIVEDIGSGNCLNINYSDVSGPVANFNPTGSPYASTSHSNSFSSSVQYSISTTNNTNNSNSNNNNSTNNNNNNKGNHQNASNSLTSNNNLNINHQHNLHTHQHINITSNNGVIGSIQPPSSLQSNVPGGVMPGSINGIVPTIITPPVKLATPPLAGLANLSSSIPASVNSAQMIESIKTMLRISGYGEDAVSEITSAVSTLASYGVLSILGVLGLI